MKGGLRQFLAFSVVGTIGLLVDMAVLSAAAPLLGLYSGRVLSFAAAVTTTWFLNRRFTFAQAAAAHEGSVGSQYLRYVVSMLGGAAVNYAVYALTLQFLALPHAPLWGVAFGSIAGLGLNFASARVLVFRRRAARTDTKG